MFFAGIVGIFFVFFTIWAVSLLREIRDTQKQLVKIALINAERNSPSKGA